MSAADQSRPNGLSSPSDPRLAAALALIWKYGLYPVSLLAFCAYLLWRLTAPDQGQVRAALDQLSARLEAHQASMDRLELARIAASEQQSRRLKGICYGVTEESSRARAFCDEQ